MCNCINDLSQKMRDELLKKEIIEEVQYLSISRTIGNTEKVVIAVNLSTSQKQKNGKLKTAVGTTSLVSTFCPFCGEKY